MCGLRKRTDEWIQDREKLSGRVADDLRHGALLPNICHSVMVARLTWIGARLTNRVLSVLLSEHRHREKIVIVAAGEFAGSLQPVEPKALPRRIMRHMTPFAMGRVRRHATPPASRATHGPSPAASRHPLSVGGERGLMIAAARGGIRESGSVNRSRTPDLFDRAVFRSIAPAFVRFEVCGARSRFVLCDSRFFKRGRGSSDVGWRKFFADCANNTARCRKKPRAAQKEPRTAEENLGPRKFWQRRVKVTGGE